MQLHNSEARFLGRVAGTLHLPIGRRRGCPEILIAQARKLQSVADRGQICLVSVEREPDERTGNHLPGLVRGVARIGLVDGAECERQKVDKSCSLHWFHPC